MTLWGQQCSAVQHCQVCEVTNVRLQEEEVKRGGHGRTRLVVFVPFMWLH